MVFASQPVNSVIRFAALPVGAPNRTFSPSNSNICMIAFKVVVFPVPGPPVKMRIPFSKAWQIAFFCLSAY